MVGKEFVKHDLQVELSVILDEQAASWYHGQRSNVEHYLARHPSLRTDREATLDLVYHEFLLRRSLGESPSVEDYLDRFPELSSDLVKQFTVDDALRSDDENSRTLGPNTYQPPVWDGSSLAIAGYEVSHELGRGGMGVVYLARDTQLNRPCALKMILAAEHSLPETAERFLAEARLIAELEHPHVIRIYSVGEHDGRPYLALEYAEGGSLDKAIEGIPWEPKRAAGLLEPLARAVAEAHRQGIVHRDLKPGNVLLDAEGMPKISDFGLAKLLDRDVNLTPTLSVLGSPSYMAPEQAEGKSRGVEPGADIYSLGAILYELLTGHPPFRCATVLETLEQVKNAEPVPPSRTVPNLSSDIETITLQCLQKEPTRRYGTADELAEDLRRFLANEPIKARPIGTLERGWLWCRRNPRIAVLVALLVTALLGGTAGSLFFAWRERQQARLAKADRDRAVRARNLALATNREVRLLEDFYEKMNVQEAQPFRKAQVTTGLHFAQQLAQELEGDSQAQFQLVEAYIIVGRDEQAAGHNKEAVESARKAVELAESLFTREPSSSRFRFTLGAALQELSIVVPDRESAYAAARRSTQVFKPLAANHPNTLSVEDGLIAVNHYNEGNWFYYDGRYPEAVEAFQAAIRIHEAEIKQDGANPTNLAPLARARLYLCRTYIKIDGRRADAIASGKAAAQTYRTLLEQNPDEYEYAWQLYTTYQELGLVYSYANMQKSDDAVEFYEKARATLQDMAQKHGSLISRMVAIQEALAMLDYNLINLLGIDAIANAERVRSLVFEAYTICDKLSLLKPLPGGMLLVFASTSFGVADYHEEDGEPVDISLYITSESTWNKLHQQAPGDILRRAWLIIARLRIADELTVRGRTAEAKHYQQGALAVSRGFADGDYEIALFHAGNADLVGKTQTKLNPQQLRQRRERFASHVVPMLREAVANGFRDAARVYNEPSFNAFRSDPAFQAILDDMKFPIDPFVRH